MDYEFFDDDPAPEEYVALRAVTGMSARTIDGVRRGLQNTIHGVTVRIDGETIGMGRVIGDGGTTYPLVDVAVHPDHQRRGLGTAIVDRFVERLQRTAPPESYVTLLSTTDGFYEQFGFAEVSPTLKGTRVQVGDSIVRDRS